MSLFSFFRYAYASRYDPIYDSLVPFRVYRIGLPISGRSIIFVICFFICSLMMLSFIFVILFKKSSLYSMVSISRVHQGIFLQEVI